MPQYEMGPRDYWRILRKRKLVILLAGAVGAGLTFLLTGYAFREPPTFRATTEISVRAGVVAGYASPVPPPNVAQEAKLVKSEDLLDDVVWAIELYPFYEVAPDAVVRTLADPKRLEEDQRRRLLEAVKELERSAGRTVADEASRSATTLDLAFLFVLGEPDGVAADIRDKAAQQDDKLREFRASDGARTDLLRQSDAFIHRDANKTLREQVVAQLQQRLAVYYDTDTASFRVEVTTTAPSVGTGKSEPRRAAVRLSQAVAAVYKARAEWEGERSIVQEIRRVERDLADRQKERDGLEGTRRQKQEQIEQAMAKDEEYTEIRAAWLAASDQLNLLRRYLAQLDLYVARRKSPEDPKVYRPIPPPAGVTDANIQTLYNTSTAIEKEKIDKLEFYKADSHVITALEEKIVRLADQLRQVVAGSIENQTLHVQTVEKRLEDVKGKLTPKLRLELDELNKQIGFKMNGITALEDRKSRLLVFRDQAVRVMIIGRPGAGEEVGRASVYAKTLVGALIGLILGVVIAVLWETFDLTIGTIEEVETFLETRVLGVVPHVEADRIAAEIRARDPEGEAASSETELQQRAMLVTLYDPKSVPAEAFRHIRTTLDSAAIQDRSKAKVFLVTSATLYEGKTTVAANLAVVMAQNGRRTCLVGCDLRRPQLHHLFGVDKRPGLYDVFIGKTTWQEARKSLSDFLLGKMGMETAIRTPGLENLTLLTSGTMPPNPVELLGSAETARLFKELRAAFDVIIVDSPPVLPVADAAVLAPFVDGAVLVYRAGSAPRTVLSRAKSQLESAQTPLLGVVLNDLRPAAGEVSATYPYKGYARKAYAAPEEETAPRVELTASAEPEPALERVGEDAEDQALRRIALLLSQGRAQEAVEAAHETVRLLPESISLRIELAAAYIAAGRAGDAQAELIHVLDMDPRNASALERLAEMALDAGLDREALGWYEQILEFDPANEPAQARVREIRARGTSAATV